MTSAHDSDPDLAATGARIVAALLAGDSRALDASTFRLLTRMIRASLARQRPFLPRESWGDICQEVLASLVAAARSGSIRNPAALHRLLHVMTHNHAIDWLRRAERRPRDLPALESEAIDGSLEVPAGSVEVAMAQWLDLARAVSRLPAASHAVVHGIYWQGASYSELAGQLGVSEATIKRRRAAALAALDPRGSTDSLRSPAPADCSA